MSESTTEIKRKTGRPEGIPKTGGRQKGTLNKKSYWLREELERVKFCWGDEFKKCFDVSDIDRCRILVDMLPYLNPKIEPRKIDDDENENDDLNINLNLNNLIK